MSTQNQKHRRIQVLNATKITKISPAKAEKRRKRTKHKLDEAVHRLCEYNKEHGTNYSYGERTVRGII